MVGSDSSFPWPGPSLHSRCNVDCWECRWKIGRIKGGRAVARLTRREHGWNDGSRFDHDYDIYILYWLYRLIIYCICIIQQWQCTASPKECVCLYYIYTYLSESKYILYIRLYVYTLLIFIYIHRYTHNDFIYSWPAAVVFQDNASSWGPGFQQPAPGQEQREPRRCRAPGGLGKKTRRMFWMHSSPQSRMYIYIYYMYGK